MSFIGYEETLERVTNTLENGYTPSEQTVAGALRAVVAQAYELRMTEARFQKIVEAAFATAAPVDGDERFIALAELEAE